MLLDEERLARRRPRPAAAATSQSQTPGQGRDIDQNFDNYSVEYTFADGAKLLLYGRTMVGCHDQFASYAHGSKGVGVISTSSHSPARCRIYKGQKFTATPAHAASRTQQLPRRRTCSGPIRSRSRTPTTSNGKT